MDPLSLLAVAVALAMDAFAVALAAGAILCPLRVRPCFRLIFHFGLFQALMPIIGWLAGLTIQDFVASWAHWIAFGLLALIGGRMIYESLTAAPGEERGTDPSRGMALIGLSVATSIDALAVGLSLAILRISIWIPALVIGLVAGGFTAAGLLLGAGAGTCWGRRVETAGGVVLVAIGLKILLSSLLAEPSPM
ncbi:MAG: manganese efflux pump MntP family protein [Desulfobulbus sp.]|jgi:putative Mn2+ efflux pump MntP